MESITFFDFVQCKFILGFVWHFANSLDQYLIGPWLFTRIFSLPYPLKNLSLDWNLHKRRPQPNRRQDPAPAYHNWISMCSKMPKKEDYKASHRQISFLQLWWKLLHFTRNCIIAAYVLRILWILLSNFHHSFKGIFPTDSNFCLQGSLIQQWCNFG